jgi:HK97 family phage prohead protease
MKHKTFDLVEVKADGEAGEFSALASVFGNVDLGGDRMMPGSFTKTLENWRQSGKPLPVVWSHDWDDPMKYIGKADPRAVMETDEGLLVQGKFDIGDGNPVADQVYKLAKDGVVTGWSFGYTVPDGGQKRAKDGVNEVREVDLIEVGPTLKGMNPEAQTQAVKALAAADEAESIDLSHPEAMAKSLREIADKLAPETSQNVAVEDATDEEPLEAKSQAQDPLREDRRRHFALATDGIDLSEPPKVEKRAPDEPLPTRAELEREWHDLMLTLI